MISKNKIKKLEKKKKNLGLIRIIDIAKNNNHLKLAKRLTGPTKKQLRLNLEELNEIKDNNILIVGKILGEGDIEKKLSIAALGYSKQAKDKLKKAGCKIKLIEEELKDNPKLEGVKIIYGKDNN